MATTKELTYQEAIKKVSWTSSIRLESMYIAAEAKTWTRAFRQYHTGIKDPDTGLWVVTDRYDPKVHANALKLMEDSRRGH